MFKKKTSIHLPEVEQGYICFMLWTLNKHPEEYRVRVIELCQEIAPGDDWKILYQAITNRYRNLESISSEHFISKNKLRKWRTVFFETYAQRYMRKK